MNGINLEKSFALNSSGQVQEICDPLLRSIGITYFNYIKIYNKDCSRELLTNNAEWIGHFYSNALYNSVGAIDIEHLLPKGYFLWAEMDTKDPIYLQGRDFFNIDHGITFVIKRPDVTLLYIFATDRANHEINNFYASNIDLLQRFIHYFTDKGQDLIKSAESQRIYLPKPQEIITSRVNNISVSDKVRAEFLENTHVNRYFLLNESDDLYLTKKQAECASLLIKGQTSKQIARTMSLSPRTVEGYLYDIRNKLSGSLNKPLNKDQIIHILRGSNIH
jgi:DNA-binding CsgD family transcriptional regulator